MRLRIIGYACTTNELSGMQYLEFMTLLPPHPLVTDRDVNKSQATRLLVFSLNYNPVITLVRIFISVIARRASL